MKTFSIALALLSVIGCERISPRPIPSPELTPSPSQSPTPVPSPSVSATPAPSPVARLSAPQSRVTVRRADELTWASAEENSPFFAFDTVRTGSGGEATLVFTDESSLKMREESWILLDPEKKEVLPHRAFLREGKLSATTRTQLWILTSSALFRLKAKKGSGEIRLDAKPGKALRAELIAGAGWYTPSAQPGRPEGLSKSLVVKKTVTLPLPAVEESFGTQSGSLFWPATDVKEEEVVKPEKLALKVTSPTDFLETQESYIWVEGTVTVRSAQVIVNGVSPRIAADGKFRVKVALVKGANPVVIRATSGKQSLAESRTVIRQ